MPFDVFSFETGRKSGYQGQVVLGRWGQRDAASNFSLELTFEIPGDAEGDKKFFAVGGDQWVSRDGEVLMNKNGEGHTFSNRSGIARFLGACLALPDVAAEMRKRNQELYSGYGPMNGAFYEGFWFQMEEVEVQGTIRDPQTGAFSDGLVKVVLPTAGGVVGNVAGSAQTPTPVAQQPGFMSAPSVPLAAPPMTAGTFKPVPFAPTAFGVQSPMAAPAQQPLATPVALPGITNPNDAAVIVQIAKSVDSMAKFAEALATTTKQDGTGMLQDNNVMALVNQFEAVRAL